MKKFLIVMSLGLLFFSTIETAQALPFGRDRVEKMRITEDDHWSETKGFVPRFENREYIRQQPQEHFEQFAGNFEQRIERSESNFNFGDLHMKNYSPSNNHVNNSTPFPVPEPATILMLASGLAALSLKSKKLFFKKR